MSDTSSDDSETKTGSLPSREKIQTIIGLGCLLLIIALAIPVSDWISKRTRNVTWETIHQALKTGDHEDAIRQCVQLAASNQDQAADALALASETAIQPLAQFTRGEELAQLALEHDPANRRAMASYIRLLTMTGRRWKSIPWLRRFITSFENTLQELIWLSDTSVVITDWDLLQTAHRTVPDDPLPTLGLAYDSLISRPEESVQHYQSILETDPNMVEAYALLGRAFLESGDEKAFRKWDQQLRKDFEIHPEVWRARGMWWRSRNPENALRCYLECCQRHPDDAQTNLQISLLLARVGETLAAQVFNNRFEKITEYLDLVRTARERGDLSVSPQAAELAAELQRPVEAMAWYRVAVKHGYISAVDRNDDRYRLNTENTLAFDPGQVVDPARWPIPVPATDSSERSSSPKTTHGNPYFRDIAGSLGLDFQYFNGTDPSKPPVSLHAVNGGGIAALDYDNDGWPDLLFTQGSPTIDRNNQETTYSDSLFRNLEGVHAQDVSENARLIDLGYGQGCTAGDFNGDGFTDVLIANIGRNRLLQNCGDGTFTDVTVDTGMTDEAWTSSCAFADLNSDTWPDLYEVRYVETENLLDKLCHAEDHERRPCPPKEFAAVHDVIWLSTGDGRFVPVSDTELPVDAGRGLGIIIANFDQQPGLDVFVGNDGTADFLLINQPKSNDGSPLFQNEATLRGVAVNGSGRMQASMGLTFGDVDRDGNGDLFQANFYDAPNTIYQGLGDGYFNDATTFTRLHNPSLEMLGWGTEFLDADLDGWLDLVVVNGHLEDKTRDNVPYQMPAQFFQNNRQGKFTDVTEASGEWLQSPRLSRALATLDWNNDGQMDFAVSALDSPAALLVGETDIVGNYLTIHLRAVESERDAIGTVVEIHAAGERLVHQLTTGDGYQTCNQRIIHLGLGDTETLDRVRVSWPSGGVQEWESLATNQEIVIVEGRKPVTMP